MGSDWRWERLRRLAVASGLELRLVLNGKEVGCFMVLDNLDDNYCAHNILKSFRMLVGGFHCLCETVRTVQLVKIVIITTSTWGDVLRTRDSAIYSCSAKHNFIGWKAE